MVAAIASRDGWTGWSTRLEKRTASAWKRSAATIDATPTVRLESECACLPPSTARYARIQLLLAQGDLAKLLA